MCIFFSSCLIGFIDIIQNINNTNKSVKDRQPMGKWTNIEEIHIANVHFKKIFFLHFTINLRNAH